MTIVRVKGRRGSVVLRAVLVPVQSVEPKRPKSNPARMPSTLTASKLAAKIERARAMGKDDDVARLTAKFAKMFPNATRGVE